MTYTVGQYFVRPEDRLPDVDENSLIALYVLARVDYDTVAMIVLPTPQVFEPQPNRYSNPVVVADAYNITEKEFDKICGYSKFVPISLDKVKEYWR